jgi:hypothetical protein
MKHIHKYKEFINEALIHANSLRQLEDVRKASKGTDIGEKTMDDKHANVVWVKNPIDSSLDTYEKQQDHNKSFQPKLRFGKKKED